MNDLVIEGNIYLGLNHINCRGCDMNGKTSILLVICLLASVVPAYGVQMVTLWNVDGQADNIAIGPGGDVYVNINQNHKVVKYSSEGEKLAEWQVPGVIETNGIAVGPGGDVYVTINNSHRVVKYSSEGEMLDGWTVEGEMTGIAVGPNGLVYVSSSNGLIQVFA